MKSMSTNRCKAPNPKPLPTRWYRGADIPMRVIRGFARQVAERFQPDKIILFGSYAYGTPHADSDVDILVIMPARNEFDQAFKIRCEVPTQFPMDLLVFKPQHVKWRLEEREAFLTEILTKGKTLYEKNDARVDTQSGRRLASSRQTRRRKRSLS
jgi:predicted nucleotidyltransferase